MSYNKRELNEQLPFRLGSVFRWLYRTGLLCVRLLSLAENVVSGFLCAAGSHCEQLGLTGQPSMPSRKVGSLIIDYSLIDSSVSAQEGCSEFGYQLFQ